MLTCNCSHLELVDIVWAVLRYQEDRILRAFGENMKLIHFLLVGKYCCHQSRQVILIEFPAQRQELIDLAFLHLRIRISLTLLNFHDFWVAQVPVHPCLNHAILVLYPTNLLCFLRKGYSVVIEVGYNDHFLWQAEVRVVEVEGQAPMLPINFQLLDQELPILDALTGR